MFPVRFDPRVHEIIEGPPIVHYVRRYFNDPLLFMFRHLYTRNFVLAAWLTKERRMLQELVVVGERPVGTKEHVQRIARMLPDRPGIDAHRKQNMQDIRFLGQRADREDKDVVAEGKDASDFLCKKYARGVDRLDT